MTQRVLLRGAGDLEPGLRASLGHLGAVVTEPGAPDPDHVIAFDADVDGHPDVVPDPHAVRLSADRESLRRLAADELGLPTAPFWFVGSVDELSALAEHAGFPLVVKPVAAHPGEPQSVLLRAEDIAAAWERCAGPRQRVLAETVVEIDYEITLITVRGAGTDLQFSEPIGHRQVDGSGETVLEAWQPHRLSGIALDAARSIAARITTALGGRGVFAVELLVRGDEVYFSDVSTRPPDAGLVTLRSQRLSVFDLYARVALGLPTDTIMISPAAAEVRYVQADGPTAPIPTATLIDALQVPESDLRIFLQHNDSGGRDDSRGRRRAALLLATGADITTARDRVNQVSRALRKGWNQ
jgi:phosphoribosylglycinamide formyltransferase 2